MARRLITGILLCFCAVLLMSYNVSAVELSQSVSFVKGYFYPYWSDNNGKTYSTGGYQYSTNGDYTSSNIQYFRTSSNTALTASAGQYVSLTGSIVISVTSQSQAVSIQANPRQYFSISSSNTDCQLIDLQYDNQQYQTQGTTWLLRYSFSSVCRLKSNVTNNVAMNFNLNGGSTSGTDYLNFIPQYIGVWKAESGFDDSDIIAAINSLSRAISDLGDKIDGLSDHIDSINNDSADATQDSVDEAQSEADSSSQSVENSTQSLLTAGTSIIGALTSAPATDCNINVSTTGNSSAFTSAIGNLNLCSDVPSTVLTIVQGMVALVFTPIVLYYVYNILTLIYAQFKEYND